MKKRVTAADVAQLVGVSRTTVSFVLNGATNKRISQTTRQRGIETSQRLGYLPDSNARRVAFGRTNVIGIVVRQNSEQVLADRFLAHILNGLNRAATAHNYHVLLEMTEAEGNHTVYTRLIGERYVDGQAIQRGQGHQFEAKGVQPRGAPNGARIGVGAIARHASVVGPALWAISLGEIFISYDLVYPTVPAYPPL